MKQFKKKKVNHKAVLKGLSLWDLSREINVGSCNFCINNRNSKFDKYLKRENIFWRSHLFSLLSLLARFSTKRKKRTCLEKDKFSCYILNCLHTIP